MPMSRYLDPRISPELSLLVEVEDLKSHGVELWRKLDASSAGDAAAAQDAKQVRFVTVGSTAGTFAGFVDYFYTPCAEFGDAEHGRSRCREDIGGRCQKERE